MKRTGEIVLGIIGILLSALLTLGGIIFIWVNKSDEFKLLMEDELTADPSLEINPDDVNMVIAGVGGFGWALVIAAIIGVVFGLIGVLNIKGNKKPKLAGWMFIIGAVLTGAISVGLGLLPAVLFLIAGIMAFARKAPPEAEPPVY